MTYAKDRFNRIGVMLAVMLVMTATVAGCGDLSGVFNQEQAVDQFVDRILADCDKPIPVQTILNGGTVTLQDICSPPGDNPPD